jgi:uncharacterized damage-inducible protein DinB
MSKDYFLRFFEHAVWANRRILKSLAGKPGVNDRVLRILSHILAADEVWMVRLRGQDSTALPILPNRTLDECAALIEGNHLHYREFLDGLTEDGLNQEVAYRNSKGIEFQTSIHDILSHVAFHGSYHRGQIATITRDTGEEPVNTDFITFTRDVL